MTGTETFQFIHHHKMPQTRRPITEVDNLQGVPPTGDEGETMVTP